MKKLRHTLFVLCTTILCIFTSLFPIKADYSTDTYQQPDVEITSEYALVIDPDTNTIFYEKNADERMYPASMTKIMTAILLIEAAGDISEQVMITNEMLYGLAEANASVAGFYAGNVVTIADILYAIALPSGADGANAAAFYTSGSIEGFVQAMNDKAAQLEMHSTHFMNPTGLHDDNHYSTASDMAKLLAYCIKNDTFAAIFSTPSYTTTTNLVLNSTIFSHLGGANMPGLIGGKTGYTSSAGRCLAAWAQNEAGTTLITITAKGSDEPNSHLKDTGRLLSAFSRYVVKTFYQPEDEIMTVTIKHKLHKDESFPILAEETIRYIGEDDESVHVECTLPSVVQASRQQQILDGQINIVKNGEVIASRNTSTVIPKDSHLLDRILLFFFRN